MHKALLKDLEQSLGHAFSRPELIIEALTHRSYFHENKDSSHNERLEFLGDSVLNLCVTELLVKSFPHVEEGSLSKLRSQLVSEKALTQLAASLKLGHLIRLGKGEDSSGGRARAALLADTFEAVLGAVFLDGGYVNAQKVIKKLIPLHGNILKNLELDYKSRLQELCQQLGFGAPAYRCLEVKGPDHARSFVMGLYLREKEILRAEGRTKKLATQSAAQSCFNVNGLDIGNSDKELLKFLKTKGIVPLLATLKSSKKTKENLEILL